MTDGVLLQMPFAQPDLPRLRLRVECTAIRAGLSQDQSDALTIGAYELASNAIRHASGQGNLRLTRADGHLRCRVTDHGPGIPAAARPARGGLSLARELADAIEVDTGPRGTAVTLTMRLPPRA